jgi:hypothetical protein
VTHYDKNTFTYGTEFEWGDVDRNINIPTNLGKWDYSETDIINSEKHGFVACDPKGENPPYGGEIITYPTITIDGQLDTYNKLQKLFIDAGCSPHVSFISHSHIHVHVPNLIADVDALKRLIVYIKNNQHDVVSNCLHYDFDEEVGNVGARAYFKYDGGRLMPDWMCDNIINMATDFDSFIFLHQAGKNGTSRGRPFRYAINSYCLKHTNTVEFRCFRSVNTVDELRDLFLFATEFIDAALNGGKSVLELLAVGNYNFPKMRFSTHEYNIWKSTKWDKSRGIKERLYVKL